MTVPRTRRHSYRLPAALLGLAVAASTVLATAPAASADTAGPAGPVQSNFAVAMALSILEPDLVPQGVNDFACHPNIAHPHPIILVNGTVENMYANWSRLAPELKADGYCVFALNYGGTPGSPFQQLGPMRTSAAQLSAFVDQVLTATGAAKVDFVGHSQGGLLPLYYINVLGGADKIGTMVGLEPASRGVTLWGIAPLLYALTGGWPVNVAIPAADDLVVGSTFNQEVAAGGYTRPGVQYTTIISDTDGLISLGDAQLPAAPNVHNIVTQDVCPIDFVDHVDASYDDISLRIVRNALDPAHAVTPPCYFVLP